MNYWYISRYKGLPFGTEEQLNLGKILTSVMNWRFDSLLEKNCPTIFCTGWSAEVGPSPSATQMELLWKLRARSAKKIRVTVATAHRVLSADCKQRFCRTAAEIVNNAAPIFTCGTSCFILNESNALSSQRNCKLTVFRLFHENISMQNLHKLDRKCAAARPGTELVSD